MNTKIIAFGDIHGCFKAAESAIVLAEKLDAQAVFLGDYVDRGPSSMKTIIALLNSQRNHTDWIFLRGNHDQMLLDLIEKKANLDDTGLVLETINFDYKQCRLSHEEWVNLPSNEKDLTAIFLRNTKLFYETEDWLFLHAILNDTQQSFFEKSKDLLIWNYNYEPYWHGKSFVHGHSPRQDLEYKQKGININTSCGYGGYLTGLLIDNGIVQKNCFRIAEDGQFL